MRREITQRPRRLPTLPAALALLMLALAPAACGGDGSGDTSDGPGPNVNSPDAGLDVSFGNPGADAAGQDDSGIDTAGIVVETPLGEACASDDECGTNGVCLNDNGFPGGYCSEVACERNADCGDGVCIDAEGADDVAFCAERCISGSQCRNGYACINQPGTPLSACMPVGNATGDADGEPCSGDLDCRGGTCIDSDDGWIDGYCTTTFCENFEDCASDGQDNRCLIQRGGTNFCVRICESSDECRSGYICQGIGGGLGYCSPNPFEPLDIDTDTYPLDITCQPVPDDGRVDVDYTIAEDTTSYMITPFASDGYWLSPIDISLPDGSEVDFGGQNSFQLTGAQLFGWTNPTVVAATPQLAEQLQPGAHTLSMDSGSLEICHYVLEESTPGTTIDFNIYLVGVPGLDAAGAPEDEAMGAVLDAFDEIYTAADVAIGEVRFYDITGDDEDRYSVVRSEGDVDSLVSLSELPGETRDDALSTNIFFVRAIALGGAIGISSGLPGPAALHGTGGSGVVFTSEFLDETFEERSGQTVDGNEYTGVVFAHEVGHYLGLFHTSEQFGSGFDPLPDTPRCGGQSFPSNCDDLNNLMFPFAGVDHVEVTEDQAWVIQVNPLTKE